MDLETYLQRHRNARAQPQGSVLQGGPQGEGGGLHAKHVLKVGVNVKEKESNMDTLYSHADPGAT